MHRLLGLLEYAGSGLLPYRRFRDRPLLPLITQITLGGGGTAFDYIFLAMAHARLGNREESRRYLAQAIFQKGKDYPSHPELARFCDEAHRNDRGTEPDARAVAP